MPGGIQLLPQYKQLLEPAFLAWYLKEFKSHRMVYVHWSAGHRNQDCPEYHTVILADLHAGKWLARASHNTPVTEDLHAHTYQRNTNSCAISVASMAGATTQRFGDEYPLPEQLQLLVKEVAETCTRLRTPVANVMTHAEAADNVDGAQGLEFYGPAHGCERWDFWCWIEPRTLRLVAQTRPCPSGWLDFADWLRGSAVFLIQHAWQTRED